MKKEIIVLHLANSIYSDEFMTKSEVTINHFKKTSKLQYLDSVSKIDDLTNGLQAAAYLNKVSNEIYIISRGADIGIGRNIFTLVGANTKFIPQSESPHKFKSFFQDWIYSAILATTGLFKFYQYEDLESFINKVMKKHPDYKIIVGGSSLGGLLSQLFFINNVDKVHKCITYSTVTPWFMLKAKQRAMLRNKNYFYDDSRIVNYYSQYDIFRLYPFFPRYIGQQKNVALRSFKTKSNFIATMVERISWAHLSKYVAFDQHGDLLIKQNDEGRLKTIYDFMNEKVSIRYTFYFISTIINFIVLASIFLTFRIILHTVPLQYFKNVIQYISINKNILYPTIIVLTIIYTIPVYLVKSRWMYLLLVGLILTGFNPITWVLILIISIAIRVSNNYE